ncbi:MAG: glycosyltransferase family 9 protein, partial [Chloroflexota bacterium]
MSGRVSRPISRTSLLASEARPGEAFRNILLILLAPIGDTLFATPTIRAVRRAHPCARLSAVVWRHNRAVLENNPDVD